jgi:pilus assembly protein CpaC
MRLPLHSPSGSLFAVIAALLLASPWMQGADVARADGGRAKRNPPASISAADHKSVIKISERETFPLHRTIKLGRNKSMLLEVPRELRDVIVSNPDVVDAVVQSATRVYLIGKKTGQANAFFFDLNGEQMLTFEVEVERDTGALELLYQRLLPGSAIKAEIMQDTVILTGSVRNPVDSNRAVDIASRFVAGPEEASRQKSKVINLLQVEGEEQVMLQVTVAEVQRSVLKQFGINWGGTLSVGNIVTAITTANSLPLTSAAGLGALGNVGNTTDPLVAAGQSCRTVLPEIPSSIGGIVGNSGSSLGWGSGNSCLAQTLRILERNGLMRTLAEPNLTATSGEAAKFLAGGEYPIPTVDSKGSLAVTFKEFGVSVAFTPMVLSEGRINLKIETEVSELSNKGAVVLSGFSIPALTKREAKSTVELPSGGTLAMAGLISEDTRKNIDGIPGLKDVPMLGTLFRSQDFVKNETELVVLVTPYVIRPNAKHAFAKPTDGLAPASDLKLNLLGHMHRVYGKNVPAKAESSLKDGSIGFIVD